MAECFKSRSSLLKNNSWPFIELHSVRTQTYPVTFHFLWLLLGKITFNLAFSCRSALFSCFNKVISRVMPEKRSRFNEMKAVSSWTFVTKLKNCCWCLRGEDCIGGVSGS